MPQSLADSAGDSATEEQSVRQWQVRVHAKYPLNPAFTRREQQLTSWLAGRSWGFLMVAALSIALLMLVGGARAATYEPPPSQSSFPPVSVPQWFDPASNAWMLTAATLVGLMSLPGLALYYAAQALIGPAQTALNIPNSNIVFFQFVFAAITPGLFAGAVIERIRFKVWMLFVPLWSLLVYSPLAYWMFAGGWLNQLGAVDFSGGYVIHLSAGITAVAAALAVGPRLASDRRMKPNSLIFVLVGAGILWLGWNGFNGGDPYGSTIDASIAVLNTELAAAASVITWMLMDMKFQHKSSLLGAMTGAVTGLVAITPAAGYVDGYGALLIGIAAGITPWVAMNKLMPKLKLDDALGVFSGHGVAGLTGGLLTGILANPAVTQYVAPGLTGALFGNINQLGIQALAAAVTVVYVFAVSFGLLKLIGRFTPLQERPENLKIGDAAIHGEIGIGLEDA